MTIKEALSLSVNNLGIDPLAVDKALLDAALDGTLAYTAARKLELYAVEYNLLTAPAFVESIQEGGYAIKYNTKGIETRLSFLASALGLTTPGKPTISDASHLW